jgi:hypothetical protein
VKTQIQVQVGKIGLRNKVIWRVVNESDVMARYVYSLLDIPMEISGGHVRFEDQTLFLDNDGFTCWRLKAGLGQVGIGQVGIGQVGTRDVWLDSAAAIRSRLPLLFSVPPDAQGSP